MGLPRPKFPSPGRVYIPTPHAPRISAKFRVRVTNRGHRVTSWMDRWTNQLLRRSGASIRTYIIRGFKVKKDKNHASAPGVAPHLHAPKGNFARPAIMYAVSYGLRNVMIGVLYSVGKMWGWKHEYGKSFGMGKRQRSYPPRPFIRPKFQKWLAVGYPVIARDIRNKMAASRK